MEILWFCPGLTGSRYLTCSLWKERCCVLTRQDIEGPNGSLSSFPGVLVSILASPLPMLSFLCAVVLGASDSVNRGGLPGRGSGVLDPCKFPRPLWKEVLNGDQLPGSDKVQTKLEPSLQPLPSNTPPWEAFWMSEESGYGIACWETHLQRFGPMPLFLWVML